MGEKTGIAWCDHTFNPWRGCEKVSAGCANCYAETRSKINPKVLGEWGPNGKRVIGAESYWREPLKWNRAAEKTGERRRVFCASLADVFEDRPELVAPRARLFSLIVETPYLDWLLLTKRPQNAERLWRQAWVYAPVGLREIFSSTVWLGVSVEDQKTADERIPILLSIPAATRFVSYEPALAGVNWRSIQRSDGWQIDALEGVYGTFHDEGFDHPAAIEEHAGGPKLDWLIVGGESGPRARPFDVAWARSAVEQCRAAGVAVFVKQLGAAPEKYREPTGAPDDGGDMIPLGLRDPKGGDPSEWPEDLRVREFPR